MKTYRSGLLAVGVGLIMVLFLFIFPYIGFNTNKQYANVTVVLITMTGLDPQDSKNLYIFAVLFFGGVALIVKGFI